MLSVEDVPGRHSTKGVYQHESDQTEVLWISISENLTKVNE